MRAFLNMILVASAILFWQTSAKAQSVEQSEAPPLISVAPTAAPIIQSVAPVVQSAIDLVEIPLLGNPDSCSSPVGQVACFGCCSNPDTILREEIAGPAPGNLSLQEWYLQAFWPIIRSGINEATNQITAAIVSQSGSIGGFMQAQNNVANLSSLQKSEARSAQAYSPSEALCRYGSLSQNLAQSDAAAKTVQASVSKRALGRQLLKANTGSGSDVAGTEGTNGTEGISSGQSGDKATRWEQYQTTFCDPNDANSVVGEICSSSTDALRNRDINFTHSLEAPLTLDIGSVDATSDSRSIAALADNLYGHDLFYNIPKKNQMDPTFLDTSQSYEKLKAYMDTRSLIAKRAVAENSFAALVGMKAKSQGGSMTYMKNMMKELGAPQSSIDETVGTNPSYYAQMEILSKKLYQSPGFYVSLMDNPANIKRQQTALKSVDLMQDRDIYESMARSEMLLAVLLEIYVDRKRNDASFKALQSE